MINVELLLLQHLILFIQYSIFIRVLKVLTKSFRLVFYLAKKAFMKNISTVLSILALVLIGVLFYLHFTHREKLNKVSVTAEKNATSNFAIAYFDIDSLQEHYEYFKDVSGD